MHRFLLLPAFVLCFVGSSHSLSVSSVCSSSNATSSTCPPNKLPVISLITSRDIPTVDALNLKTDEQLVARQGHVEGVKPLSYNLTFNSVNKTHHVGSVEIEVIVVEATKRIVLNRRFSTPQIDYDRIRVFAICGDNGARKVPICVAKIVLLNDSFVLETSKQLEPNATYLISIPSFLAEADPNAEWYDPDTNEGSIGLASSGGDESGFWGLTTIFQMRYARTVFPCFDHPSLKARFSVCLEHPASWIAASNRPLNRSESINRGGDKRHWKSSCFKSTPPIPTYVFTFALMENYSYNSMVLQNGPLLELYSPTRSKIAEQLWILNGTKSAVNAMHRLTSTDCGLEKLSIFFVYTAPSWGIESYGLITVPGVLLESRQPDALATSILNRLVIRQWLGDVVTVSNWREICIQEGLTTFVEWLLSDELQNVSLKGQEAEAASSSFRFGYDPLITQYNLTKETADYCFSVPPLLFNNIYDYYGRDAFKTFLNHVISQKYYANADVDFFDRSLVNATGDRNLSGYLREWFGQPGPLYLFIARGRQNAREIQIRQGYVLDRVFSDDSTIRPVLTKVLGADGRMEKLMIPMVQNFSISMKNGSSTSILIDPDNELPARKVYEWAIYNELASEKCNLSSARQKVVWNDFCESLILDAFPWGEDARQFDSSAWSGLFSNAMLLTNENEHGACRCCMRTYEENKDNEGCYWTWAKDCQKLRIIGLMGRNYTLPEGSPFG